MTGYVTTTKTETAPALPQFFRDNVNACFDEIKAVFECFGDTRVKHLLALNTGTMDGQVIARLARDIATKIAPDIESTAHKDAFGEAYDAIFGYIYPRFCAAA